MITLYSMKMIPTEGGLQIWTNEFVSVHETPCYYFCVRDWQLGHVNTVLVRDGETMIQSLRRRNVRIKKIAKENSRFAFKTKEEAYKQLVYMKNRQMMHLKRDVEFLSVFLRFSKNSEYKDLAGNGNNLFVPDTDNLVREHYVFD